ncbi:tRNA dihydrouridine synthase DusB [Vulgatibacter incomptus]|nr:tRNA dihydrouridine synthase DusB [Vulgatibacter incomptus]
MRIGPHELKNRWILAPMAGISEMPFRSLAFRLGAGLCPTELVSAEGLMRASNRTMRYLRFDPKWERPFSVQVFGGKPEVLAEASKVARDHGAQIIDVNMGCPVPKVTKSGSGCALMSDPDRAAAVITQIAEATGLPVTAKIRAGIDSRSINCVEVGLALQEAGCQAVALHPRTRAQGYSGSADWTLIKRLKDALRIPVIGNGDVKSVADAHRMLAETGCDAVMIGRGALGNPWLFRELEGGKGPTTAERHALVMEHFEQHLAFCGDERRAVHQFRKHLAWYAKGLVGSASFRSDAMRMEPAKELEAALDAFFSTAVLDRRVTGSSENDDLDDDGVDYRAAFG